VVGLDVDMGVTTGVTTGTLLGDVNCIGVADVHDEVEAKVAFNTELKPADLVAPLITMKHEFGR
jgi:hypothetical protein